VNGRALIFTAGTFLLEVSIRRSYLLPMTA